MRNEVIEEIQEQPIEIRSRGRPKGTTKDVMELRRAERLEEQERNMGQNDVRRSERIRNQQSALLITDDEIPKNIDKAMESSDWKLWKDAIKEELTSLDRHKIWDVVPRPKNKKIIKCKWIFNIKEDPNTEQRRYKARLVALGCGQ